MKFDNRGAKHHITLSIQPLCRIIKIKKSIVGFLC